MEKDQDGQVWPTAPSLSTIPNCVSLLSLLTALSSWHTTAATIEIVGAGASFPRGVYQIWMSTFEELRRDFVDVSLQYDGKGSGVGLSRIMGELEPPVHFAGSDSLLTESDYIEHPDLQMFPTIAGAIVLAYHLPGQPKLTLTREQIVGIFNGTFTYWNDSSIQATNPLIELPEEAIKVIVRADSSGTTEILTSALSAFDDQWRANPGTFANGRNDDLLPSHWNADVVSQYGRGVYDILYLLSVNPFSLGYVSLVDANEDGVAYANIINRNGDNVAAGVDSVKKTIESFTGSLTESLTASLVDSPSPGAYPLVGYTYFVVRMSNNSDCTVAKEFLRFIKWFMSSTSARRACEALDFALVTNSVKKKIESFVVDKMKCENLLVIDFVNADIAKEKATERYQHLELPLKIAVPCVVILFICTIAVIVYLRIKGRKTADNNGWNINIEDVIFFEPSSVSFTRSRSRKSTMSMASSIKEGFHTDGASLGDILHWPAKWNNYIVSVKIQEPIAIKPLSTANKQYLASTIGNIVHENVVRFFGLSSVCEERYIITEYCRKGVLRNILNDGKLNLNAGLKFSISIDVISGLEFLHANGLIHGCLNTSRCLLDGRWTVKIADWEVGLVKGCFGEEGVDSLPELSQIYSVSDEDGKHAIENFWTAPEIIKSHFTEAPTKSSDVYSFAICLQEIFTREEPFGEQADNISPREVLILILTNNLRPHPTDDIPLNVRQIMEIAWAENAESRPTCSQISGMLNKANPGKKSVMDSMMETLEEYASHLENTIEEKAAELDLVKKNASQSYCDILPPWLVSKLSNNEIVRPKSLYTSCLACVCLSGISSLIETTGSDVAMEILSDAFNCIIQCVKDEGLIFIPHVKTPILISTYSDHMSTQDWVINAVDLLLGLVSKIEEVNRKHKQSLSSKLRLRLSLHMGAATVAYLKPLSQLTAFGPGVDIVKYLIDHSREDDLLVSEEIYQSISMTERYHFDKGIKIRIKDKCPLMTYWLSEADDKAELASEGFANMASVEC